ncbi:hypothetical protein SEPCBS119000_006209 [Sporothrix epigloea]|uniref:Uncharacterized protein n=1 Tax=Sporothrix epigloea TaxID=1892477 RepID=A0ABP0E3R1_9PEZI
MSGLSDEAVMEGHDLMDGAEHEAKADPKDFKKVHPVGETGGSILPEAKAGAAPGAEHKNLPVVDALRDKLAELKDKF